jgi:DNA polymerase-3 subunit delta
MYFTDFTQKIRKDPLPALTLLFGEAEGVIAEGTRLFRERFRKDFPAGSVLSFDAQQGGLEAALDAARAVGLFASDQLIVLYRADKGLGGVSEAGVERLRDYFKDPVPFSRLLFLAPGAKASSKTVRTVEKLGWTVQCAEIHPHRMAEWAVGLAKEKGLRLSEGAARLLAERTGSDPAHLRSALDQLALLSHPGGAATEKEVAFLPIPGIGSGIFELQDQVGLRRVGPALRTLQRLEEGVDVGTLVMLYLRIRDLLGLAAIKEAGGGPGEAAQRLGMHPFRVTGLWEQAGHFSPAELREALWGLSALQEGAVTGRLGKGTVLGALEAWIIKWGRSGPRR